MTSQIDALKYGWPEAEKLQQQRRLIVKHTGTEKRTLINGEYWFLVRRNGFNRQVPFGQLTPDEFEAHLDAAARKELREQRPGSAGGLLGDPVAGVVGDGAVAQLQAELKAARGLPGAAPGVKASGESKDLV